jgi:hypothetical protein
MDIQKTLFEMPVRESDIVYTPVSIAKDIITFLSPKGKCLDPCRGDGAFYNYLPTGSDYCEIREGKDFFDYSEKVDWIIGNPPYSIFEQFLAKSFQIADNVAYLVPTNKIFQRQIIMERINNYGGIKSALIYGSGQLLDFPFGFSVGLFHFQKQYKGDAKMIIGMTAISKLTSSNYS